MPELLDGRLSLTTPEGVRLHLVPAGPPVRALAWAVDFALFIGVVTLVSMFLASSRLGYGLYLILLFVTYWAYPVLCEVYAGGATVGKRVAGIEVVQDNGLPVRFRESALRNLLLVADFLPLMYATGLVAMLFDARFRRVGDLAAGTMVVYRDRKAVRGAAPDAAPVPLPFPLTPAQQRALADLFAREPRLPAERLEELGSIAEPLTGRTGMASLERLRGMAAGLLR
ncbi:RDD family protein [Massilia arenosa]|uniref:RDD family protein n=1 Tax=Zemynaea arenosa TaxID=2561931 RepID=A0A4Y9SMM0_9BURK|nr:RDD family protein [Massilia arenosa]TFW27691.1 RDD family protein [Massilia arenosa]